MRFFFARFCTLKAVKTRACFILSRFCCLLPSALLLVSWALMMSPSTSGFPTSQQPQIHNDPTRRLPKNPPLRCVKWRVPKSAKFLGVIWRSLLKSKADEAINFWSEKKPHTENWHRMGYLKLLATRSCPTHFLRWKTNLFSGNWNVYLEQCSQQEAFSNQICHLIIIVAASNRRLV